MCREYPFTFGGLVVPATSRLMRFPLLDPATPAKSSVVEQLLDPNSILYAAPDPEDVDFPERRDAMNATAQLAGVLDAVERDSRDENLDFGVFARTALIALGLAELTVIFSEDDLIPHQALVAELQTRLVRLLGRLVLVEESFGQ